MIKKTVIIIALAAAIFAGGLIYDNGGNQAISKLKPVIHSTSDYPYLEIGELAEEAAFIVHGIVENRGKTVKTRIPISIEIDVNKDNEGQYIEEVETPISIKVISAVKPKTFAETEVVYMEEGGELPTVIIKPSGGALQEGDEVVLFLNEAGRSWGSLGVLKVSDGKVSVIERMERKTYIVDELWALIRNE